MRILVIEDEISLNQMFSDKLKEFGYQRDVVNNIKDGSYYVHIHYFDLVIIDYNLVVEDFEEYGYLDIVKDIKSFDKKTVVIMISDNDDKDSEIKAFKFGADDYIKKPIDFDILNARIESHLYCGEYNINKIKDLSIDLKTKKITYKKQDIELHGKAFEVFIHLLYYKNQIVEYRKLIHSIWEEPDGYSNNILSNLISQIRKEIVNIETISIETLRRRGYRLIV